MTLRHDLHPGDLGRVLALHGELYAREHGFDLTFEGYVAATLGQFAAPHDPARARLWLAEDGPALVGCVAIVRHASGDAQLRWLLVAPSHRGTGLGARLLREAVEFARAAGYRRVFLDTIAELPAAARLYTAAGFTLIEEKPPAAPWGRVVREQRYELLLRRD